MCIVKHTVSCKHTHTWTYTHTCIDATSHRSDRTWVQCNHNNYYYIMQLRSRRQAGSGTPTPHGDYLFAGDGNQYARVYYSGSPSPVSLPTAFQLLWLLLVLFKSACYGCSTSSTWITSRVYYMYMYDIMTV